MARVSVSPWSLFVEQILIMNPSTFLIWISGVVYFLTAKPVKTFRILSVIYLTVFFILCINGNSKSEYLGPMFPLLFSMGAVSFEKFIISRHGEVIARFAPKTKPDDNEVLKVIEEELAKK